MAPKSNALYVAETEAKTDVAEKPAEPVPAVIRNAVTRLMKEVGYGRGYRYAHAEPEGVGGIECLPESLRGRRYYRPRASGEEAELSRRLEPILKKRQEKWAKEEGAHEEAASSGNGKPPRRRARSELISGVIGAGLDPARDPRSRSLDFLPG